MLDVLIIGAGQSGLAAGYWLKRLGLSFSIIDQAPEPGGSWPRYYDSLSLFSPAAYSSLPGLAFPGPRSAYPKRDQVVDYLRGYAARFDLPVQGGTEIVEVRRRDGFEVVARDGRTFQARAVIAATGSFGTPHTPVFPDQGRFTGRLLHSRDYRRPADFAGLRVVVVGGGNSAIQIAHELAGVAKVSVAVREPVRWMPQRLLGQDIHFWSKVLRLDSSRRASDQGAPVIDDGHYRGAIADGAFDIRTVFQRFTENGVVWSDGQAEAIDAAVFATGYRPGLDYLGPTGALDDVGRPLHQDGVSANVPGLYFLGVSGQSGLASATLRGAARDSAPIARSAARFVRKAAAQGRPAASRS